MIEYGKSSQGPGRLLEMNLLVLVKAVLPALKEQGWHLLKEGEVPDWFERIDSMRTEVYRKKMQ